MTDKISKQERSKNMQAIRSKDTKPEMFVRRVAHRAGFRFRLHRSDLPGKPDLVFRRWNAVIFVHGCFWHGHGCARGGTGVKSNVGYWAPKLERTKMRDEENKRKLEDAGWRVMTLWECELQNESNVEARIRAFLGECSR